MILKKFFFILLGLISLGLGLLGALSFTSSSCSV